MVSTFIQKHEEDFHNISKHFKQELSVLRTGKATPALVENVSVEVYGVQTPLLQLASISVPDPRTIVIEPWDKSILKEIEKGIIASSLNINPVVDGERIRISLPAMTEDARKQLVKVIKDQLETARISLRHVRDDIRTSLHAAEKEKEISEDDRFRMQRELDEYSHQQQSSLEAMAEQREKEVMTI